MAKSKEAKAAKKASAKEAKKEKQLIKAHKKRAKEQGLNPEEEDIEFLLKKYEINKTPLVEAHGKLVPCEQPLPRAACTLTQLPSGDYFLFGGEFYEGSKVVVYNESYRWNIDKGEWRRVESPIVPKPRCSHQAVLYKDQVYVFGGEFATVEQFHHFRDLWRFDPKTNTWEEVQVTGVGPSARSGHRMVVWKNYLVVFGGFHDTLRETRYFNDVHVLNFQSCKWAKVTSPSHALVSQDKTEARSPSPRSGVLMACHSQGDGVLVCGGYCKVKDTSKTAQGKMLQDAWWLNMHQVISSVSSKLESGNVWEKLGKKATLPFIRSGASCVSYKSMVICFGGVCDEDDGGLSLRSVFYNDLHAFDLERKRWHTLKLRIESEKSTKKLKKDKSTLSPTKRLESTKFEENEGEPSHETENKDENFNYDSEDDDSTTFGYIDQDGKLVRIRIQDFSFTQVEKDEVSNLSSMQQLNDSTLKCSENNKTEENDNARSGSNLCLARTADIIVQSGFEMRNLSSTSPPASTTTVSPSSEQLPVEEQNIIQSVNPLLEPDFETPLPRLNACLVMKGNELIIYGGLVELGRKELTLDDCWSINLNTRKKWNYILKGHLEDHPWNEEDEDEDENDDGEFSCSNSDSGSDSSQLIWTESEDGEKIVEIEQEGLEKKKQRSDNKFIKKYARIRDEINYIKERLSVDSVEQTPQMGESLRDFFERTKNYWMEKFYHDSSEELRTRDPKELRRGGFELASLRFEIVYPVLERLEHLEIEQKQAEENELQNEQRLKKKK